jgi:anti-sigma factor RsiW
VLGPEEGEDGAGDAAAVVRVSYIDTEAEALRRRLRDGAHAPVPVPVPVPVPSAREEDVAPVFLLSALSEEQKRKLTQRTPRMRPQWHAAALTVGGTCL